MRKIEYEVPDDDDDYDFLLAEYTETEGLAWYLCETSIIFGGRYRKYTEKNLKGCDGKAPGLSGIYASEDNSVLLGIILLSGDFSLSNGFICHSNVI